ncbi:phosphotransferase family protein [Actinoplanes sp. NPDC049681]|uniref:phosphotransferase family protein n=1 Tax=Actinoplanes sp. NPDC049681 TaxID=3363905 RepID=UPI0037BB1529
MLTPPADLPESLLRDAFGVESLDYRPVGWGSHHWTAGDRYFLTVDDLTVKRLHDDEDLDLPYERLRQALDAASGLRLPFVVAPVRPLVRLTARYAAALYRYVPGESFSWGDYPTEAHRDAVREMLVQVHTAAQAANREDFVIPHRQALSASGGNAGPFAERAARLVADHAEPIQRLLDRHDSLAASADPARFVLTHGEPHPGNTMRTADGWKLIDWDTALLAPPERDLWLLGGDHTAYTAATGIAVRPEMLELYRLRWLLNDLCVDSDRFRRPHSGTPDDEESWELLRANVTHAAKLAAAIRRIV